MQLTYTDKNEIPEADRGDFVEFDQDGKTVHMHKDLADSKREQYRLKGDLTKLTNDHEGIKSKLQELSDAESERQRKEKERKDKKLADDGKHDEIIADLRNQIRTMQETHKTEVDGLKAGGRKQQKKIKVEELVALATPANREVLRRVVAQDLEALDDGTIAVIGSDGKATGATFEQYKASLAEKYPGLVAAPQSKGGQGQGGGAGGSPGGNKELARVVEKVPALRDLPVN